MLLLIVFYLSAHVLCTVRDSSLSRLIDEGFGVSDQVMARDSRGFDRVVSQFQGPGGPLTDVVPSWLLGGVGGTSVEIHLGARIIEDGNEYGDTDDEGEFDRLAYEIEGMDNWIISYTYQDAGLVDLGKFAANELLFRCRYILPVNIVYFSRPNPGTAGSWIYTIVDNGPRRLLLGASPVFTYMVVSMPFSLRRISQIIKALTDWSLLLRRYRHIRDRVDSLLGRSQADLTPDNPEFIMAMTKTPGFRTPRPRSERVEDASKILLLLAHLIHHDANRHCNYDLDEFIRRAFFLDSELPEPLNTIRGSPCSYRFETLQEVIGDEFPGYEREYIRSKFAEFVRLFRLEWDNVEPNPVAVLSIVDLIEDQYHILK
jgi:hypothetical protein